VQIFYGTVMICAAAVLVMILLSASVVVGALLLVVLVVVKLFTRCTSFVTEPATQSCLASHRSQHTHLHLCVEEQGAASLNQQPCLLCCVRCVSADPRQVASMAQRYQNTPAGFVLRPLLRMMTENFMFTSVGHIR
jgi:hypothetical protein